MVLSAGSLNCTEILLRSEMHGLSVSPALGTKFNGNGDFFGLAYNGDYETDVLGYPYRQTHRRRAIRRHPARTLWGWCATPTALPEAQRIAIEDFSFPSAYVDGPRRLFGLIRGVGHSNRERRRATRPPESRFRSAAAAHDPNGAMNHSMLYLVMGQDNARGTILFEAPLDRARRTHSHFVGQGRAAADLHADERGDPAACARAARQLHFQPHVEHVQPAAPGDGASAGRLSDGRRSPAGRGGPVRPRLRGRRQRTQGTHVADGSVIPSALGVNPFLTISALSEHFVARRIEDSGQPVSRTGTRGQHGGLSALEAIDYNEGQLETLFRRCPSLPIDQLVNAGGAPQIDLAARTDTQRSITGKASSRAVTC